jgi:hypothetical protein
MHLFTYKWRWWMQCLDLVIVYYVWCLSCTVSDVQISRKQCFSSLLVLAKLNTVSSTGKKERLYQVISNAQKTGRKTGNVDEEVQQSSSGNSKNCSLRRQVLLVHEIQVQSGDSDKTCTVFSILQDRSSRILGDCTCTRKTNSMELACRRIYLASRASFHARRVGAWR